MCVSPKVEVLQPEPSECLSCPSFIGSTDPNRYCLECFLLCHCDFLFVLVVALSLSPWVVQVDAAVVQVWRWQISTADSELQSGSLFNPVNPCPSHQFVIYPTPEVWQVVPVCVFPYSELMFCVTRVFCKTESWTASKAMKATAMLSIAEEFWLARLLSCFLFIVWHFCFSHLCTLRFFPPQWVIFVSCMLSVYSVTGYLHF